MIKGISTALVAAALGIGFAGNASATEANYKDGKLSFKNGEGTSLSISNQLQVRLTAEDFTKFNDADTAGTMDSLAFGIRRLKTTFSGEAYNMFKYKFTFAWTEGQTLETAYVGHDFNDSIGLYMGRTKNPFNLQEMTSSSRQQFADRSRVNEEFNQDFATGLWIQGAPALGESAGSLNYWLGVSNGVTNGVRNSGDKGAGDGSQDGAVHGGGPNGVLSDPLMLYGRVQWSLNGGKGVAHYESDLRGNEDRENLELLVGLGANMIGVDAANALDGVNTDITTITLDARVHYMGFSVNAAYFMRSGSLDTPVGGEDAWDDTGMLIQAGYNHNLESGDQVEIAARYGMTSFDDVAGLRAGTSYHGTDDTEFGVGVNYRFGGAKEKAKLTLDYHQRSNENSTGAALKDEASVIRLQFQLKF